MRYVSAAVKGGSPTQLSPTHLPLVVLQHHHAQHTHGTGLKPNVEARSQQGGGKVMRRWYTAERCGRA